MSKHRYKCKQCDFECEGESLGMQHEEISLYTHGMEWVHPPNVQVTKDSP